MRWSLILLSLIMLVLSACDRFHYGPYEPLDLQYTNLNSRAINALVDDGSDTCLIAVIGDTQRFYSDTEDIVERINAEEYIDMVIHTGDLVDFGVLDEFELMHEILTELNVPYIAVVGNHDHIGHGDEIYEQMYGPLDFYFQFKENQFIFVNTNSREHNFDGEVPSINWIESALSDTVGNWGQSIIVQHIPPIFDDFDLSLSDEYEQLISSYGHTELMINGHRHSYDYRTSDAGLTYLNSASTSKGEYVLLKVWPGGHSVNRVQ